MSIWEACGDLSVLNHTEHLAGVSQMLNRVYVGPVDSLMLRVRVYVPTFFFAFEKSWDDDEL
jgi:hypothetical protein